MFRAIKKWFQRNTDTKPDMPRPRPMKGDLRIRNNRSQVLTYLQYEGNNSFSEQWEDQLTYMDKRQGAECPKCTYAGSLYEFKWNDNSTSGFTGAISIGGEVRQNLKAFKDGESCGHGSCLKSLRYPCEGCGRINGKM